MATGFDVDSYLGYGLDDWYYNDWLKLRKYEVRCAGCPHCTSLLQMDALTA